MGVLRNVNDLVADVQQLAEMQNTDFVTSTEIIGYLNDAYREAYSILAKSYEDWNLSSAVITTSSGTREYTLATDFMRLRKIMYLRDYNTTSEKEYPIKRVNWSETDSGPIFERVPRRFMLRGNKIRFFPCPSSVLYYRYYYSAAPTALAAGGTNVDFFDGLDRFIVWDAVVRCLIKEKSDPRDAREERDRHLAIAIQGADNRDASEALQIQEVVYSENEDWWDWRW
jgi:hypothetical protein